MIYLVISIICSVSVGVLLKLYRRYSIDVNQTIAWNYLIAIFLSWYFFEPTFNQDAEAPRILFLTLGVLLPLVFWFLTQSLKSEGLAKTDIAQRLSLVIPLTAAWLLFNEQISLLKLIGLFIGVCGVLLVLKRHKLHQDTRNLVFPVLVFVGYGVIDVLFKLVAKLDAIPYTTALFYIFLIAALVSVAFHIYQFSTKRINFQIGAIIPGIILGVFNFGNILSYLKAHRQFAEHPSTVFAAMNLGVIILGSFIGVKIFKEYFSRLNYIGIMLALIAVIIITIAQRYAI